MKRCIPLGSIGTVLWRCSFAYHDSTRETGGTAALTLNPGTRRRWVVSFTSRPLYPRGKRSRFPLNTRLSRHLCRSERFGRRKIPCLRQESSHDSSAIQLSLVSSPDSANSYCEIRVFKMRSLWVCMKIALDVHILLTQILCCTAIHTIAVRL
jgi:hypothetical protein